MSRTSSVRNAVMDQSKGKDGRDHLGGLAKKTPAQSATNETKQSTVERPPTKGANGGWNTNS